MVLQIHNGKCTSVWINYRSLREHQIKLLLEEKGLNISKQEYFHLGSPQWREQVRMLCYIHNTTGLYRFIFLNSSFGWKLQTERKKVLSRIQGSELCLNSSISLPQGHDTHHPCFRDRAVETDCRAWSIWVRILDYLKTHILNW